MREFNGYLQADAYSGYEALYQDEKRDVTEVTCWAHARRKFYDARSSDPMRSLVTLASIRFLYDYVLTGRLRGKTRGWHGPQRRRPHSSRRGASATTLKSLRLRTGGLFAVMSSATS